MVTNALRRLLVRLGIALAGLVVVILGLVLVPLPGPGWLIVFGGIAIWAIEFPWARRLLTFARDQVGRWQRWWTRRGWGGRLALAVPVLLALAGLAWVSLGSVLWD
jgi:uncharacterized protein (TIGR02611 family)